MRQQVIAKIHWGARKEEVVDWLQEEHGIEGLETDQLLAEAYRARRKAIRKRALVRLIFSAIGIALVVGFVFVRFFCGYVFVGVRAILATIFAINIGFLSVGTFFRSIARIVTGDATGSVD